MTAPPDHVGRRLRARREALGLSVEDVAARLRDIPYGVKAKTLTQYEEQAEAPHEGARRIALAQALEVDHGDLFPGEPLTVGLADAMERAGVTEIDVQRDLGVSTVVLEACRAGSVLKVPSARRDLAHYLGVPHDSLWPRSPLPPGLPRLATGRRGQTTPRPRAAPDRDSQAGRVLTALRAAGPRGLTVVDFLAPDVIDGGAPIVRLPSRIDELRRAGCEIDSSDRRGKVAVYRLIREPAWP